MKRRAFLLGSTGFSTLGGCTLPNWEHYRHYKEQPPNADRNGPPLIDVHCHVFNGQDLAIAGFITAQSKETKGDTTSALVRLISGSIQSGAANESMFFETEIEYLSSTRIGASLHPIFYRHRGQRHVPLGSLKENFAPGIVTAPTGNASFAPQVVLKPDEEKQGRGSTGSLGLGTYISKPRASLALLLEYVSHRHPDLANFETDLNFETDPKRSPILLTPALVDMNNWVQGHDSDLGAAFGRLKSHTLDRTNRAVLEGLLGLTFRSSTIKEQMRVMKVLSQRRPGGLLIHPFIAYDPWRGAVDLAAGRSDEALQEVQDAILYQGAIGVKLYPPMGFRPSFNYYPEEPEAQSGYEKEFYTIEGLDVFNFRTIWPSLPYQQRRGLKPLEFRSEFRYQIEIATRGITDRPVHSEFLGDGKNNQNEKSYYIQKLKAPAYWLDKALTNLYNWCNNFEYGKENSSIPIMAHTNASHAGNGEDEYFQRANPAFWEPILRVHKNFNFNFAHAGNFDRIPDSDPNRLTKWADITKTLVIKLNDSPKIFRTGEVFVDFADVEFEGFLERQRDNPAEAQAEAQAKAEFFQDGGKKIMIGSIMYGSDFPFNIMTAPLASYRRNFELALEVLLEKASYTNTDDIINKIMYRNAARFLSINKETSKTVERLKEFHRQALKTEARMEKGEIETQLGKLFEPFFDKHESSEAPLTSATRRRRR